MEDKETGELNSSYFIKQCTRNVCSSDNVVDKGAAMDARRAFWRDRLAGEKEKNSPHLHSCFLLFSLQVCI